MPPKKVRQGCSGPKPSVNHLHFVKCCRKLDLRDRGGAAPGRTSKVTMHALIPLTLVLLFATDPDGKAPRERSPYAPSLPRLTDAEEQKLDGVIDRFVQQDVGVLKGPEAQRAVKDFIALKPEAIPALIRGLNRTAKIEHSCPCLLIAKKLERLLLASDDRELLEYARDEIGSDVGKSRRGPLLQDLRLRVTLRMNALARRAPTGPKAPRQLTLGELAEAASRQ